MKLCIDFLQQERVREPLTKILEELHNDISVGMVKAMAMAAKVAVFKEATETVWFKELKDDDVYAALQSIVKSISPENDERIYILEDKGFTEINEAHVKSAKKKIDGYSAHIIKLLADKLNVSVVVTPEDLGRLGILNPVDNLVEGAIGSLLKVLNDGLDLSDELADEFDITWPIKVENGLVTFEVFDIGYLLEKIDTVLITDKINKAKMQIKEMCSDEVNDIFNRILSPAREMSIELKEAVDKTLADLSRDVLKGQDVCK